MLSPRRRGLTLVELMVALAILAFAMTAAAPTFSDWVRNLAVRNAAESLRSALDRARIEALRRNGQVGVWLVSDSGKSLTSSCVGSETGPSWVVAALDPSGRCDAEPSLTQAPRLVDRWAVSEGAEGVQMATQGADGNPSRRVLFNSMGQVIPGGDQLRQIDVTHPKGGRALRVVIEAGGSVRVCDPAAAAGDIRRC